LEVLLRGLLVLPFDAVAALAYGQIIAQGSCLHRCDYDRMIAAHAINRHSVLVTNNTGAFSDIPSLPMENWVV
jgi:tRNA(fMet)-specific endonuclease VapC